MPTSEFAVDEIPSDRWELALALLRDGGPLVVVRRELALGLQRHVGWPKADGLIHVSAFTHSAPSELDEDAVQRDGVAAVGLLHDVVAADPRLAQMLDTYGTCVEYVYDYGNGAVRIGVIGDDGVVALT